MIVLEGVYAKSGDVAPLQQLCWWFSDVTAAAACMLLLLQGTAVSQDDCG
jgi:7-keto-8-aminopelargonate synthetase-like enzyme